MSGQVEMMRQELIKAGLSPQIVDSMSADRLEAECRKRNIELQSGLNNNANWGNVGDGFVRESGTPASAEKQDSAVKKLFPTGTLGIVFPNADSLKSLAKLVKQNSDAKTDSLKQIVDEIDDNAGNLQALLDKAEEASDKALLKYLIENPADLQQFKDDIKKIIDSDKNKQ